MSVWTCVRCGTTIDPFVFTANEELIPDLTEEAEAWVSANDQKMGRLCPDCATQAEKWSDAALCVRCGADVPRGWDEHRDGEFHRISAGGGVCPECWVPADAEAEAAAMELLGPIIGKVGFTWSPDAVARNAERLQVLERLRRADGPGDFEQAEGRQP